MKNRAIHAMIAAQQTDWELSDIEVEFLYSEAGIHAYQIKYKGVNMFQVNVEKFNENVDSNRV